MVQFSLSACSVVKRYGGVVALANGNLDVHSGEVVALLGANGSGKSTLSKIITGVVSPDAGTLCAQRPSASSEFTASSTSCRD
jgi:ribose transport system ATP-binding protein